MMDWIVSFDDNNKTWTWYFSLVDWTAGVIDDSQCGWPKTKTHYRIMATSRSRIAQGPSVWYLTLEAAKKAALDLAFSMERQEVAA